MNQSQETCIANFNYALLGRCEDILEIERAVSVFLGGTRSGKSDLAQSWLLSRNPGLCYVATLADDDAIDPRVRLHRDRRPDFVTTVELESGDRVLEVIKTATTPLLIDSLGTWLIRYDDFCAPIERLIEEISCARVDIAVVCELVGEGLHGATPVERLFIDCLGEATQALRSIASSSFHVMAGGLIPISKAPWIDPDAF